MTSGFGSQTMKQCCALVIRHGSRYRYRPRWRWGRARNEAGGWALATMEAVSSRLVLRLICRARVSTGALVWHASNDDDDGDGDGYIDRVPVRSAAGSTLKAASSWKSKDKGPKPRKAQAKNNHHVYPSSSATSRAATWAKTPPPRLPPSRCQTRPADPAPRQQRHLQNLRHRHRYYTRIRRHPLHLPPRLLLSTYALGAGGR